jgi:23S rRNA pseudouridine1911/1915/1917 synthase
METSPNKIEVEIPILYEDETCMFINKPAGISVHGDGKTPEFTLADWILEYHPMLAAVGEPLTMEIAGEKIVVPKPGIVHRLDKDTSGVMLLAKTHEAYEFFKKQFQEREIQKTYHCFVYGWPKEDTQEIAGAIGRDSGNIRRWTVSKNARGTMREAVTHIEVKKRFGSPKGGGEYDGKGSTEEGTYSFVEARPKTGRTHQIRVHLRSINHPIVADSLYAPKRAPVLGFARQALHARELTLTLASGKSVTVQAPYPADFAAALKVVPKGTPASTD